MLPADSYALVLDLGTGAGLHRGEEQSVIVNSECAFLQSPLQRVEVTTPPDFDVLFVKLNRDGMVNELQKMLGREIHAELAFYQEFRMQSRAGQRLRELLRRMRGGLSGAGDRESSGAVACFEFQKELASLNTQPWRLATGCDPDGRPLARDETHLRHLYEAAPSSPEVAHALLAVQHLLRPAGTLTEVRAI